MVVRGRCNKRDLSWTEREISETSIEGLSVLKPPISKNGTVTDSWSQNAQRKQNSWDKSGTSTKTYRKPKRVKARVPTDLTFAMNEGCFVNFKRFLFFFILLGYNLFTKLCSFEVYSKMIQTHIYIYSLFRIFSHVGFFCVFVCAQLCLPLCGPLDYSPLGSSVPVISQPFPSPWDLPNPGIEPKSPALTGRFFRTEPSRNLI